MARRKHKLTLMDQLREAIRTSDKSANQIARESGLDKSVISRFMHGKGGMSIDGLDRLAEVLRVKLVPDDSEGV